MVRERHMLQQQLGAMQIHRIVEYQSWEYVRTSFFPGTTPEDWARHEPWMKPHAMDPETGNLTLIMQAYLVRTRHHNIIVDTQYCPAQFLRTRFARAAHAKTGVSGGCSSHLWGVLGVPQSKFSGFYLGGAAHCPFPPSQKA